MASRLVEPYVKVTERVRETPTLLNIDGSANIGGVVVSPKGARYQYIAGPRDFLDKLVGADELPRDSHISLINAYYCSYFAGLVVARSLNTQAVSAIKVPLTVGDKSISVGSITKPTFIGDTELNSSCSLSLNLPDPAADSYTDESPCQWAFAINNVIFYYGDDDYLNEEVAESYANYPSMVKQLCNSVYDVINAINSWSGFNAFLAEGTASSVSKNGGLGSCSITIQFNTPEGMKPSDMISIVKLLDSTTGEEGSATSMGSVSELNFTAPSSDEIPVSDRYLLIKLSETGAYKDYKISLKPKAGKPVIDGEKQYGVSTLMIQRGDNKSYYDVSINPNDRDESGNNCYIDNLNAQLSDISFELVGFDNVSLDQWDLITSYPEIKEADGAFGADGYNLADSMDVSSLSSAVYALADQKQYDIEYLSPFGITASAFIKDYVYVGQQNWWFTPVDIPYNYTTAASIKIFASQIKNSNNVIIGGPFDKNSGFLGWICKIAWSSLYYERVFINRANSMEWAPCFEETNGVLSYANPMLQLGETDRVDLLNGSAGPVVFTIFNQQTNTYYLNDNWCHTTTRNVMSEEMNRRMINKIAKDEKRIMNRFKGRTNTQKTREDVVSILKIYMDNNIMNQFYKPVEYLITCDESNNTVDLITANKLAVRVSIRLLGSIKYIDVLNDIFPLGIEFEN